MWLCGTFIPFEKNEIGVLWKMQEMSRALIRPVRAAPPSTPLLTCAAENSCFSSWALRTSISSLTSTSSDCFVLLSFCLGEAEGRREREGVQILKNIIRKETVEGKQ
jgi:hypothetical protein